MIDRAATARAQRLLAADPIRVDRELAVVLATAPPVQNRPFPLPASALFVRQDAALRHRGTVEAYVGLLDRMLVLYRTEPEVRAFFGLSPHAERLVLAGPAECDRVEVARLDGYLEATTERLRFLENNADAPAGSLFTPRVNAVVDEVHHRLGVPVRRAGSFAFDDDTAFARFLIERGEAHGLHADGMRVAVLQLRDAASVECRELVDLLGRLGVQAFLADPRAIEVAVDGVSFADRRADLCWNKVNTEQWRRLVEPDANLVELWCRALRHDSFLHINPMAARYVAENKLALALLQEPRFAPHFDARERELVADVLPWSRRLGAATADLELREAHDLVLKAPYDIRGDGVTVGHAVDDTSWSAALDAARREGHLVQAYVRPAVAQVWTPEGGFRPMAVSLDSFVWGGRFVGFGAKAGTGPKVNVYQGGRKLAVRVMQEV